MIKFSSIRDNFRSRDFSLKSARSINNQHDTTMAGPPNNPPTLLMLNDSPVNMDFMLELFS